MPSTTASFAGAFLPDDFGDLLIATASRESVALQTTTVVATDRTEFRIPVVTAEPATGWYTENEEISPTDPGTDEEVVRPRKVAALTRVSNELASDSTPEASQVVGDSIGRSIATAIDAALYGDNDGTGVPPKGLGALDDEDLTLVELLADWENADPFIEAVFRVAAAGGKLTAFIANPTDAEALAKLKQEDGSNVPLLQPDVTQAGRRTLSGVPLYVSAAVDEGTIWGYDRARIFTVLNKSPKVETSDQVYFTSDGVAVRGIARVAFGYPHLATIAKITAVTGS